jgi:small basic protein (TIGR04137 family)
MSIHPSLKAAKTMKRHRSVLSRLERIKILQAQGKIALNEQSVLGLPKVKHLKVRVRKEKTASQPEGAAKGGSAPSETAKPSGTA